VFIQALDGRFWTEDAGSVKLTASSSRPHSEWKLEADGDHVYIRSHHGHYVAIEGNAVHVISGRDKSAKLKRHEAHGRTSFLSHNGHALKASKRSVLEPTEKAAPVDKLGEKERFALCAVEGGHPLASSSSGSHKDKDKKTTQQKDKKTMGQKLNNTSSTISSASGLLNSASNLNSAMHLFKH